MLVQLETALVKFKGQDNKSKFMITGGNNVAKVVSAISNNKCFISYLAVTI